MKPHAGDHPVAGRADHGCVSKGLSREDMGDMDLYFGEREHAQGIMQRIAVVGQCPSIDDEAVAWVGEELLKTLDDGSLVIGLKVIEGMRGESLAYAAQEVIEGVSAIDVRFSLTEQVEVGAVDDEEMHGRVNG